jgi:hypothetical protein
VLAALRRHLFVSSWAILSSQALLLALGTGQMCLEWEHRHGGAAAPDCPMHHHMPPATDGAEHAHHGHAVTHEVAGDGNQQQITCRCSTDVSLAYLGEVAIREPALDVSPVVDVAPIGRAMDTSGPDHDFSPPLPPPR